MSAAYLELNQSLLLVKTAQALQSRIDAFAQRHDVAGDVAAIRESIVEFRKQAAVESDDDYALIYRTPEGQVERHYPLRNSLETKAAADYAVSHRSFFTYPERRQIAERVLQKTAEFGVALDAGVEDVLRRQAGYGVCRPKEAAEALRRRATAGKLPTEAAEHLSKIADCLEINQQLIKNSGAMGDVACVVDQLDRAFGLTARGTRAIPYPEDFLFDLNVKEASQFTQNACGIATGSIYDSRQFARLSPVFVAETFGEKTAAEVTTGLRIDHAKMAKLAGAMTFHDASRLDRLMQQIDEAPPLTKTGGVGMSEAERKQATEEYLFAMSLPEPTVDRVPSGV